MISGKWKERMYTWLGLHWKCVWALKIGVPSSFNLTRHSGQSFPLCHEEAGLSQVIPFPSRSHPFTSFHQPLFSRSILVLATPAMFSQMCFSHSLTTPFIPLLLPSLIEFLGMLPFYDTIRYTIYVRP